MPEFIKDNSIMLVSTVLLVGLISGATALQNNKAASDSNTQIAATSTPSQTAQTETSPSQASSENSPTGNISGGKTSTVSPTTNTPSPTISPKPSIRGIEEDDD